MKILADRVWSAQQEDIFAWFETSEIPGKTDPSINLVVRARAGTGKTTTIIEGVNRAPEQSILLAAFNKRIADELNLRLNNRNAKAMTLHAIGFRLVLRAWENINVCSPTFQREKDLTDTVCGDTVPDGIKRLVSTLHTKGREICPHATVPNDLRQLAVTFDCEPDETWKDSGYDTEFVLNAALQCMELAASKRPASGIDFADMIYLPIRNGWLRPMFDLVVVDEAQDMTVAQLELARGVCRPNGRICVVGDDRQAIYKFRGADSDSLDRLKKELNAAECGLTTTYRCGKAIVAEAQKLVPDFQAGENNSDGEILTISGSDKLLETVANGDFVLSRKNAPLIMVAMNLLKNGKRARIAGKDIGKGLKSLIHKLARGRARNSVPELLTKVANWKTKETARYQAAGREDKVEYVIDQADMITTLAEGVTGISEIETKIDRLFTDDGLGQAGVITCSSVHKAKGLEADRVLILADTIRVGKKADREEENIKYVAVTRAKHTLIWVKGVS